MHKKIRYIKLGILLLISVHQIIFNVNNNKLYSILFYFVFKEGRFSKDTTRQHSTISETLI